MSWWEIFAAIGGISAGLVVYRLGGWLLTKLVVARRLRDIARGTYRDGEP